MLTGDASFKLGDNKHAGNGMIPRETGLDSNGDLKKGAGDTITTTGLVVVQV